MRLVIDTNVVIAAFISHGACNELLEHCVIHHEVVFSEFIFNELKSKLIGKFKFTGREADAVVRLLRSRCSVVDIQALFYPISKDPDDDNIIATAISGACECIITGDSDLLDLKQAGDIVIISPNKFWQIEKS
jgi:uncharacterized protein